MARISAYDEERLKHINSLMDEVNEDVSGIYENLVDREFDDVVVSADSLILKLEEIKKSVLGESEW